MLLGGRLDDFSPPLKFTKHLLGARHCCPQHTQHVFPPLSQKQSRKVIAISPLFIHKETKPQRSLRRAGSKHRTELRGASWSGGTWTEACCQRSPLQINATGQSLVPVVRPEFRGNKATTLWIRTRVKGVHPGLVSPHNTRLGRGVLPAAADPDAHIPKNLIQQLLGIFFKVQPDQPIPKPGMKDPGETHERGWTLGPDLTPDTRVTSHPM